MTALLELDSFSKALEGQVRAEGDKRTYRVDAQRRGWRIRNLKQNVQLSPFGHDEEELPHAIPLYPHSPDAHVHVVPARKRMLSVPVVNGHIARLVAR